MTEDEQRLAIENAANLIDIEAVRPIGLARAILAPLFAKITALEVERDAAVKERDGARDVAYEARRNALEVAASIAWNGCLVPPDGGAPTDDERIMCENIADAIRALAEKDKP